MKTFRYARKFGTCAFFLGVLLEDMFYLKNEIEPII